MQQCEANHLTDIQTNQQLGDFQMKKLTTLALLSCFALATAAFADDSKMSTDKMDSTTSKKTAKKAKKTKSTDKMNSTDKMAKTDKM
jgi:hypothetical protein